MSLTLERDSLAEWTSSLPADQRKAWLDQLSKQEAELLWYDWAGFWARPAQLPPPGDWTIWLICAGRGFGKTRTGAEWVRESVKHFPLVNMIAATADDARDIMVEGESGILAICPDNERPIYKASQRRLEWPNGARSLIFTADEPERLRGKQHMRLWADEVASWRYPDAWDQAMFGLRLGSEPRAVVTTTPRPTALIKSLLKDKTVSVTRGSTYDNRANLSPAFYEQIITKYEGTRLGRQELMADILEDTPGALWNRARLDELRVWEPPQQRRVVVAVDPSGGEGPENDEQGIAVCGLGVDGHGYMLDDRTCKLSPEGWARVAVNAYHDHKANYIVAETNFGGAMVTQVIKSVDPTVPVKVVTASRGKAARAEPVASLDAQGRIHQVGSWPEMEDELCSWDPLGNGRSPNRLDARVWGMVELLVTPTNPNARLIGEPGDRGGMDRSDARQGRVSAWR
jgi:phage terminase large subunit-like protein